MVSRELHNERSRITGEQFCFFQDDTGADNCCDTHEVSTWCNPGSSIEQRTCDQGNDWKFCSTRYEGCCHDGHFTITVILNRTGSHDTRNTTTTSDQHRNEGFSGKSEFTEDTIHDEGNTCHVTAGLQKCQEQEQYQHLRYKSKYGTNTGYDTIEDQTLQPVSAVDGIQKILNCRRNDLTEKDIVRPVCYNRTNGRNRYIVNDPHNNRKDRKCQPAVGYDTVDLIRCCHYVLFVLCDTVSDDA